MLELGGGVGGGGSDGDIDAESGHELLELLDRFLAELVFRVELLGGGISALPVGGTGGGSDTMSPPEPLIGSLGLVS
jgi:hypothetical protein